ncbi:MAG: hypothetical protein KAR47_19260, partial [Planctomycetes bacterium]|nr:hypothetical protein [Planctomycetota bacterium]
MSIDDNNGGDTSGQGDNSSDDKFVPICSICGEKHWPFSPMTPCVNKDKIAAMEKAQAKERKNSLA